MGITAHQKLRVIWERLFPIDRWRDPETLRQAGRVAAFDLTMFFWVVIFAPIYALLGSMPSVVVLVIVGIVLPTALVALQRGLSPKLCGNILCWAGWLTYTALVYVQGGMSAPSPTLTWFASLPICAVYMCGLRSGIFWTAASILAVTGFAVADHFGFQCPNTLTPFAARLLQFLALAGLITCVYALVHVLTRFELSVRRTLHEANCRLEAQSSLDALTGIANRRSFDWCMEREWKRHERAGMPISVALIDVDWFKQYNDTFGHLAGDDVLRSIAFAIQSGVHRPGDFAARFGGEEFAVILSDTDEHQARYVMAMIHQRVRAIEIPYPDPTKGPFVTISIGIATVTPCRGDSFMELIHEADVALYQAKAEGRDRAIHASRISASAAAVQVGGVKTHM